MLRRCCRHRPAVSLRPMMMWRWSWQPKRAALRDPFWGSPRLSFLCLLGTRYCRSTAVRALLPAAVGRIALEETGFLVSWRAILVGEKRCGGREPAHLVLRSSLPLRITIPDPLPIHRMGRWSSDTQLDLNSRYSHIYSPRSRIPSTVANLYAYRPHDGGPAGRRPGHLYPTNRRTASWAEHKCQS